MYVGVNYQFQLCSVHIDLFGVSEVVSRAIEFSLF